MNVNKVFRALGDETRMGILEFLAKEGEMKAGDICAAFPQHSPPGISAHLKKLLEVGLVTRRKEVQVRWYNLDKEAFDQALEWIHSLGMSKKSFQRSRFNQYENHGKQNESRQFELFNSSLK